MAELQFYDKLLLFPWFLGMSHNDVMELVAHTKLDFFRLDAGTTIVNADEPCTSLIMLVNGQIESNTRATDNGYWVEEVFNSPYTLQPSSLFGPRQRFTSTFTTSTRCNFISIDKNELLKLFHKFEAIRINWLNILSNMTDKSSLHVWTSRCDSNRDRIIAFMQNHCLRPAGHKTYHLMMKRLAKEINASRLEVSIELNKMANEGLLSLSRGRITVPFLERLVTL